MARRFVNIFFILLLFISFTNGYGQGTAKIDSLKTEFKSATQDTTKALILSEIADKHSANSNFQESIKFYLKARELYLKLWHLIRCL